MVVDGTMSHRGFSTVDASPPRRHQTTVHKQGGTLVVAVEGADLGC